MLNNLSSTLSTFIIDPISILPYGFFSSYDIKYARENVSSVLHKMKYLFCQPFNFEGLFFFIYPYKLNASNIESGKSLVSILKFI